MESQFTSDLGALAPSHPGTSDSGTLDSFTVATTQPGGGEDSVEQALAHWQDRERRRIEFRCSLMNARASLMPVDGREKVEEFMRRRTAEVRERRPAHVMAELANVH